MWSHTILVYFSTGYFIGESQFICASCHTGPFSLPRKENPFTFCSPPEYRHSLLPSVLCPVFLFLSLFLRFLSSPLPTPAVFHLNISSSCLAASAACQVSSRSQGPTLKWSMEVIFRGVCVCVWEEEKNRKRKGKRWRREGEAAWLGSETSGGDKKWKGGEDMGVITNVFPVYFLFSPCQLPPHPCRHPLSPSA